jgi:hypothetical protein
MMDGRFFFPALSFPIVNTLEVVTPGVADTIHPLVPTSAFKMRTELKMPGPR